MINDDIENPLIALATQPNAKQKVFSYMTRNMGKGNKIILKQKSASKEIHITPQHMSRVLKQLEIKCFIVKTGKEQVNNVYMINPDFQWKGDGDLHEATLELFIKAWTKRNKKDEV